MEIKDVIHGRIELRSSELPILDSPYFQRLRMIKQLGFSEYSYPTANHNRYIHSLGAMETASRVFDQIFDPQRFQKLERFKRLVRLTALLHDIGHGPLSHTSEIAMPAVRLLKVPGLPDTDRKATHEDYTLKMVLDSGLTPLLEKAGAKWGIRPQHIAQLIDPSRPTEDDFFLEHLEGQSISLLPILQQMISSELDCDRMDYLRRDSFYAGVTYGQFDADWLMSNLSYYIRDEECHLTLSHRALYTFEDFLISRYHMFLMVYFHYKGVIFDQMLGRYLDHPDCTYALPTDIEKYCLCNDAHLHTHLAESSNEWARRISQRKPYKLLFELHSGIPADPRAMARQKQHLKDIREDLQRKQIDVIESRSTGELSKYFRRPGKPIFVKYENYLTKTEWLPLQECTDLFERYKQTRLIQRLYISPEDHRSLQKSDRIPHSVEANV